MMADNMRKAVFRTDASLLIGTGHVMRTLTLAEALKEQGVDVRFICREHEGHLCALIEERGFSVSRLPAPLDDWRVEEGGPAHAAWLGTDWQVDADQTLAAIKDMAWQPQWLIVDHYALDVRWERRLRGSSEKIMVIDDLADRVHDCDVLLDQNMVAGQGERYKGKVPCDCVCLIGPAYALLQPDYAPLRELAVPRMGPVRRLLVFFGGVDKDKLTSRAVNAILKLDGPGIETDIILSASSPQFDGVRNCVDRHAGLRLHDRVPSLAPFMLAADLAIGAGGATNWERLSLGLPSLVVTVADNQRPIAEELARLGLVRWLGDADAVGESQLREALEDIIDTGLDGAWSHHCLEVVDALGTQRVCSMLLASAETPVSVRLATADDEDLLLEWANNPVTRQNAFNPDAISPLEHREWFQARLQDSDGCLLYIAETTLGVPLGQVRFDRRESEWEISYSIAPAFRGRGLGRRVLETAIHRLGQRQHHAVLFGQVQCENVASRRIFEALGFSTRLAGPDRHIYERQL